MQIMQAQTGPMSPLQPHVINTRSHTQCTHTCEILFLKLITPQNGPLQSLAAAAVASFASAAGAEASAITAT